MYTLASMFVLAATSPGDAISSGLGINALAFLSQLISFGIVFFLLWRYLLPAIVNLLDKRADRIREGIENAEKADRRLADANKDAEQIVLDARRQAQEIIERAQKTAQQEASRIQQEAQARADQIGQQLIARIQQEANRTRNDLSRRVVDISIDAAGRVIGHSVNSDDNRRLVQDFVTASSAREQ